MNVKLLFLGQPQILYDNLPVEITVKKAVALLAYLATTGKAHSRERLATLLWPDSDDSVARTGLRQVIQALRQTPLASVLMMDRINIDLHPDVVSDVKDFQYFASFKDYEQTALTIEAVSRLQSAEALYRGEFMQDFRIPHSASWEDWQQFRRIEFEYQATRVVAALTRYYAQEGLPDSGLKMAARWLKMDPLNEQAHLLTMRLYMLQDQTERALEQYHLIERLIEREYGRAPDAEVRNFYEQLRNGEHLTDYQTEIRDIRTLLPRPIHNVTVPNKHYDDLQVALGLPSDEPSFLTLILDEQNVSAPVLIAELAHDPQIQAAFPDGILWAALTSENDLEAVLRLWLDAMRISVLKSTSKLEHLAWQFHNGQRGKRLLFLLENVREARHIELLKPGYVGCALVITTALRGIALHFDDEVLLALESDY